MVFHSLLRWKIIILVYQFSLQHLYVPLWKVRRVYFLNLGVKGLKVGKMYLKMKGLWGDSLSAPASSKVKILVLTNIATLTKKAAFFKPNLPSPSPSLPPPGNIAWAAAHRLKVVRERARESWNWRRSLHWETKCSMIFNQDWRVNFLLSIYDPAQISLYIGGEVVSSSALCGWKVSTGAYIRLLDLRTGPFSTPKQLVYLFKLELCGWDRLSCVSINTREPSADALGLAALITWMFHCPQAAVRTRCLIGQDYFDPPEVRRWPADLETREDERGRDAEVRRPQVRRRRAALVAKPSATDSCTARSSRRSLRSSFECRGTGPTQIKNFVRV